MAQSQFPDVGATAPQIAPDDLKRRLDAGDRVTVLDTRRPADVRAWRIEHPNVRSVNVPFYEFLDGDRPVDRLPDGVPDPGADERLVVNCAVGASSQFVGDLLTREGRDVAVLTDGMEGWARVYDRAPVRAAADGATVHQYHRPATGCLAYLVVADGEAAAIDPLRAFADRYAADARAEGAELRYAMDTHVHADHLSGVRAVAGRDDGDRERSGPDGESGPDDPGPSDAPDPDARSTGETAVEVESVLPAGARDRGLAFDPDRLVAAGDRLAVGSATVEVVGLPGHTTEHVGYRVGDLLLCGDTLFPSGVGRPDLEAGDDGAAEAAARLYDTVRRVLEYPDETVVGSGHAATPVPDSGSGNEADDGDARGDDGDDRTDAGDGDDEDRAFLTTVGRVRDGPLAGLDREAFVDRLTRDLPPRPNNFRQIVAANLGRDAVADPFRVELGPNNCAVED